MNETKWSPGPWTYRTEQGDDRYIRDERGVALFCDTAYYPYCTDNEHDWPLVAAAPTLHDALERIIAESEVGRWHDAPADLLRAIDAGRAALARARGESD